MSCWSGGFTEKLCCALEFGPEGNQECWDGISFTYKKCCPPRRHLCWNGEDFTQEVCCVGRGGNAACWDGMYFTYEKCCPPPVLSCVPTESFVAFAFVMVAIFCVLLYALLRDRSKAMVCNLQFDAITTTHSAFLDNARFFALVLVVWAHVAHTHIWYFVGPASAMIKLLRFHMPLMCIISGTVSHAEVTEKRLARMVARLVAPLILFVLVVLPFFRLVVMPAIMRKEHLEPAWTFTYFYGDVLSRILMIGQWDIGWYIRCLLCWRLALPLLTPFSTISQAVIALIIGIMSAYTSLDGADTSFIIPIRVASLFPYFCFGKLFGRCALMRITPQDNLGRLMLGWTAFLWGIVVAVCREHILDKVVLSVELYPDEYVSLRRLLTSGCPADIAFLWARYCAALMLRGGMSLFFLYACVPRERIWFTVCGMHTMYPYLLHLEVIPYLYRVMANNSWRMPDEFIMAWTQGMQLRTGYRGCYVAAAWFLAAFTITVLLSSRPCRFLFRFVVEPGWICCNGEVKREKTD